jgi:TonB family protein
VALTAGIVGAGLFAGPDFAAAQIIAPQAIATPLPETPEGRAGMPIEGWALLRFTVTADGRTADARVIAKAPPRMPDRDIRDAIDEWMFEPATADGEPIDWYNNEVVIVLDAEAVPDGTTPAFMAAYSEADELLRADDHEAALRANERMIETTVTTLADLGLAQVQNAAINLAIGDQHAAHAAIVRATDPRIPVLGPDELRVALQYRNVLELQLGDIEAAIDTLDRRRTLGPIAEDDPVGSRLAAIEEALQAEDSAIAVSAKLLDGQWHHKPSRRTFAIGNIEGSIETILVECDRRAAELDYMPEAEYTLPESWGECSLAIEGRRDSTFRFYEFL